MDHRLYAGTTSDGTDLLLTVYDDGTRALAVRADGHAFGPEVELTGQPFAAVAR